jgi:hypothetical protein
MSCSSRTQRQIAKPPATSWQTNYAAAKAAGYVPALVRQVVKERRLDAGERADQYARLARYRDEVGLFADTPLGEAALRALADNVTPYPRPFAEQPVHDRRRGRPRKSATQAAEDLLGA